jgi:hypothetical protein
MQRDPPSGAAAANSIRAGYRVVRDEVTQIVENGAAVPTTQFPVMIKVEMPPTTQSQLRSEGTGQRIPRNHVQMSVNSKYYFQSSCEIIISTWNNRHGSRC